MDTVFFPARLNVFATSAIDLQQGPDNFILPLCDLSNQVRNLVDIGFRLGGLYRRHRFQIGNLRLFDLASLAIGHQDQI